MLSKKINFLFLSLLTFTVKPVELNLEDIKVDSSIDKKNIVPIAVLGAGPAGLTAALYGARGGMHTVVFTGDLPGGQLMQTNAVENWPGSKLIPGSSIVDGLFEQVKHFGVKIIEDSIVKVNFKSWPFELYTSSGDIVNALSVVIATGAASRKLGIPGEMEYFGHGVSSCALCDCHFFKDKNVVIVGGGDAAIEEAMQLSSYAKNITIFVRSDRMRAAFKVQEKLQEFDNVKVVYHKQVVEVIGDGSTVTGVKIKDTITDKIELFKTDGLFLAIGQNPNTNLFSENLELNKFGYIIIDPNTQETSLRGVFAAGDVEDAEYRQAVVAAASGCKSGHRAVKWLREIGLTEKTEKVLKKSYFH